MPLRFHTQPRFTVSALLPGRRPHAALAQQRVDQKRAEVLTAEQTVRAWAYARYHHVSFAEAVRELFEEE